MASTTRVHLALRENLPEILEFFSPVEPRVLADGRPDPSFVHGGSGRPTLLHCALVCRNWTRPSQLALFQGAIVSHPWHAETYRAAEDSTLQILRTLRARPDLGGAVRHLMLLYPGEDTMREVLRRCPSVTYFFCVLPADSARALSQIQPMTSVRRAVLHLGDPSGCLSRVLTALPNVEQLQLNALIETRNLGIPAANIVVPPRLSHLALHNQLIGWLPIFARAELALDTLELTLDATAVSRFRSAGFEVEDFVLAFRDTLRCLGLAGAVSTNWAKLEQCGRLQHVRTRNLRSLPHALPPRIESVEMDILSITDPRASLSAFVSLARRTSLRKLTLYNPHDAENRQLGGAALASWASHDAHRQQQIRGLTSQLSGVEIDIVAE